MKHIQAKKKTVKIMKLKFVDVHKQAKFDAWFAIKKLQIGFFQCFDVIQFGVNTSFCVFLTNDSQSALCNPRS